MCIFDNRSEKEREEAARWQMDIFDRAWEAQKAMQENYERNKTVTGNNIEFIKDNLNMREIEAVQDKRLTAVLGEAVRNFLPDDDQIQELGLAMGESLGYEGRDLAIFVAAYQAGAKEIMSGLTW